MAKVLAAALAMAARGYRVFPCARNSREPYGSTSPLEATTDETTIRRWFSDPVTGTEYDLNYGVAADELVIIDVDLKKGPHALDNYVALGGHFDTLTVRTPTGGYHCYFVGPTCGQSPLAPAVDVRGWHGYVVGPGSEIDGSPYRIENDVEPTWVPLGIEGALRPPGSSQARAGGALDTESGKQAARDWLRTAAPAIEGQNGNDTTYRVAAKLTHDYALSVSVAMEVLEPWNERCVPPWPLDDLRRVVEHAAEYGKGEWGSALPEKALASVTMVEHRPLFQADTSALRWGNALDAKDMFARPWVVPNLLLRGQVTTNLAPGSTGKSTLGIVLAAHLVNGKDFGRYKIKMPGKVVVYNAEDPIDEQSKRLLAVCMHFGFDYQKTKERINLLSAQTYRLVFATTLNRAPVYPGEEEQDRIRKLIDFCSPGDVACLILDPLIALHTCDENSNGEMRFVMSIIQTVAEQAGVSVFLQHHTTKGVGRPGVNAVDMGRGAGDIINASRVVVQLGSMDEDDQRENGISPARRGDFMKMMDGKTNLYRKDPFPQWFQWHSIKLSTGDSIGVPAPVSLGDEVKNAEDRMCSIIFERIRSSGGATISVKDAIEALQSADALWMNAKTSAIRNKMVRMLAEPGKPIGEGRLKVIKQINSSGTAEKLLITWF